MEDSYLIPSPKQRAVALLKLLAPGIVIYALYALSRFYSTNVAVLPTCAQLPWIRVIATAGVVALFALAYWCYRNGIGIWRSGQHPTPGTSVLFKTRISTGWWARSNAITMFIFAALTTLGLIALLKFFVFSEAGLFIVGLRSCVP